MASPAAVLAILVEANTKQANAALTETQARLKATATTAETSAAKTTAAWSAAGKKMSTVGSSLTKYVTVPVVAVGAAAIKMSIDFHKSMTLVQTQAGASAAEVEKMTVAIQKFAASGKTAFGPNELAQGLYAIESAGIRGAKALDTLKASSKLAMIGQVDLASTTKALVAAQKTGIQGSQDLNSAIGTLNATVGSGQMHMEDLLSAMGTGFLGTAKQLGISLTDVGGALAELTKQGVPAASAATRLKQTFISMATIETRTGAAAAIKHIGLSANELSNTLRNQGLLAALQQLQDHMQGLSKASQTNLLATAFGGSRSGGTIMQLLGNLGDLNTTLGSIHQKAGQVNQDFAKAKATSAEELQIQWAKLQAVLVDLGDKLIPVVIPALQKLASAAETFIGAFAKAPTWVIDFLIGAVAVGPFLKIASGIVKIGVAARGAAAALGLMGGAEAAAGAGGATSIIGGGAAAGGLGALALPAAAAIAGGIGANKLSDALGLSGPSDSEMQAKVDLMEKLAKAAHQLGTDSVNKVLAFQNALQKAGADGVTQTGHLTQNFANLATSVHGSSGKVIGAIKDMSQAQRDALQTWTATELARGDISKATAIKIGNLLSQVDKSEAFHWGNIAKTVGESTAQVKSQVGNMTATVSKNFDGMVRVTGGGINWLGSDLNNFLKGVGAKEANFRVSAIQNIPHGHNLAGLAAGGAIVPGVGSGDRHTLSLNGVPIAKVESGELVSVANRTATSALMGVNGQIQRKAQGGVIQLPGVNMTVGQEPQILGDLGRLSRELREAIYVISGYRSPAHSVAVGGFANDPHTTGSAADIGAGSPTLASMFGVSESSLRRVGLFRPFYPPSAAEANHVQLIAGGGGAQGPGPSAFNVPRLLLHGPAGALRSAGQGSLDKARAAALKYGHNQMNFSSVVGTGGSASANEALGRRMMLAAGWGPSQWPSLLNLWMQESGWNANAVNPTSGAYGIPQSLGHGHPYALGDARAQIAWGLNYIRGRYGSPSAAWGHEQAFNWYGNGTDFIARRPQVIGVGDGGAERVQVTPVGESKRYAITITNWHTGEGYMREIAADEVDGAGAHGNQLARMGR